MSIISWIPNLTRLETVTLSGIMTLGKYTLPKIPALALKVFDVPAKH